MEYEIGKWMEKLDTMLTYLYNRELERHRQEEEAKAVAQPQPTPMPKK